MSTAALALAIAAVTAPPATGTALPVPSTAVSTDTISTATPTPASAAASGRAAPINTAAPRGPAALGSAAEALVATTAPISAATALGRTEAPLIAAVEQPRTIGYFVGDLLTQRVPLDSAGSNVKPVTLPTPGRVSTWFERRKVTLETDASSRRWLSVEYQILNAPQKLTVVKLPAWTLPVKAAGGGGPAVVLKIPASQINVAPLSQPGSPTQVGAADLRPDRLAPLVTLAPLRRAAAVSASALVLTLVAWLGWLIWRNRRAAAEQPFARALRELRVLKDSEPRAWQALHRAFDRTAGRVIQNVTLPELFERAPQLLPAREQIEHFFTQSSELFFGARPSPAQSLPDGAFLGAPTNAIPAGASLGATLPPANLTGPPDAPRPGATATIIPRTLCAELRRIERHYEQ